MGGIIGYKWSFMKSCECFIGSGWENLCGDDVVLGLTGAGGLTPPPLRVDPLSGGGGASGGKCQATNTPGSLASGPLGFGRPGLSSFAISAHFVRTIYTI